ncbi:PRD domain-containing protein [Paenibacillus albiflavus]|uniref:PRD domain-containing protein n=1 Tax=Paenibacillus albiflavus TaxID=2545760 RepID=A0A4R4ELW2_9BACL|nr:PRD domain-containing protein [Paenibacillus albiflavus]TCZ81029.1 PRD domain-containing protein [Paenibacillus albiflavus]
MQMIETLLKEIPGKTTVTEAELDELRPLLDFVATCAKDASLKLSDDKMLVIGIHLLAFTRRVKLNEYLPELDESMFEEVSPELVELSRRVLQSYLETTDRTLDAAEIFYLTVHFEAAKFNEEG